MTKFSRKVLWALDIRTSANESRLFANAAAAGCKIVCVRSVSKALPGLIGRAHQNGLEIYAWRWPAARPQPNSTTHYYADDEAAFVAKTLIPAGLDGYVVDPESEGDGKANDWDDKSFTDLAERFCRTIKTAAKGRPAFRFGLTSGCNYPSPKGRPNIPWTPFAAASDFFLPQSYWRVATSNGPKSANGGTPAKACQNGLTFWKGIAKNKPVIPMAGELASITTNEIAAYGAELSQAGIDEAHFFIDGSGSTAGKLAAIQAL